MTEPPFPYPASLPPGLFTSENEAQSELPGSFIDPSLLSLSNVDQSSCGTNVAPDIVQTQNSRQKTWQASPTHCTGTPCPSTSAPRHSTVNRPISRCSTRSEERPTRAAGNRVQKTTSTTKLQMRPRTAIHNQIPHRLVDLSARSSKVRGKGGSLEWRDDQSSEWSKLMRHTVSVMYGY